MFLSTFCLQNLNFVCVLKIGQFSVISKLFRPVICLTAVAIDRTVERLGIRKDHGEKQ
jgi:hypothetical protein